MSVPSALMRFKVLSGCVNSSFVGSSANKICEPSGDHVGVIGKRPAGSANTLVSCEPSGATVQIACERGDPLPDPHGQRSLQSPRIGPPAFLRRRSLDALSPTNHSCAER